MNSKNLRNFILTSLVTIPLSYPINAQEQTLSPIQKYDCSMALPETSSPSFLETLLEKSRNCNLPKLFNKDNIQYDLSLTSYGATLYFHEAARELPDRQINGPGIIFTDEPSNFNCTRILLKEGNGIIQGNYLTSSIIPRTIFDYESSLVASSSNEQMEKENLAKNYCIKIFGEIRKFYNER